MQSCKLCKCVLTTEHEIWNCTPNETHKESHVPSLLFWLDVLLQVVQDNVVHNKYYVFRIVITWRSLLD